MACLNFGYKNLLYILLLAISSYCQFLLIQNLEVYSQMIFMILDSISLILLVFLEDISIMINTDNLRRMDSLRLTSFKKEKITLILPKQREKDHIKYSVIVVIILSLLAALNNSLNYFIFFNFIGGISAIFFPFNILFTWLLLFFWVKLKMFRHHFLSLIIFLAALIVCIIDKIDFFDEFVTIYSDNLTLIGGAIFIIVGVSLREVLEKYAFDVLFIKHFRLLFYEGVGSLLVNLIVLGFVQFFNCQETIKINLEAFCLKAKINTLGPELFDLFGYVSLNSLYIWIYLIVTLLMNISRVMINRKYGPTHRYTGDLLAFIVFIPIDMITNLTNGDKQWFDWKSIMIILLLIIGCLIYNENLRIMACQLAINTKIEIEKRATRDSIIDSSFIELNIEDAELNQSLLEMNSLIEE